VPDAEDASIAAGDALAVAEDDEDSDPQTSILEDWRCWRGRSPTLSAAVGEATCLLSEISTTAEDGNDGVDNAEDASMAAGDALAVAEDDEDSDPQITILEDWRCWRGRSPTLSAAVGEATCLLSGISTTAEDDNDGVPNAEDASMAAGDALAVAEDDEDSDPQTSILEDWRC